MNNVKTNIVAALKALGALAYVIYKHMHGQTLTEADIGIVTLAFGGALGNWMSADAKAEK